MKIVSLQRSCSRLLAGFAWALMLCVSALAADDAVNIDVVKGTPGDTVVSFDFDPFESQSVMIGGQEFSILSLDGFGRIYEKGHPALPTYARSVIIPNTGHVALEVIDATFHEIENVQIAPSKGHLPRTIDPATVPYTFADVYGKDAYYPAEIANLGEPYIMRDVRGAVVHLNPFQYNPATGVLRVYDTITVQVVEAADVLNKPAANTLPVGYSKPSNAFGQLIANHFLNGGGNGGRYNPLDEDGEMLVIVYDQWESNVQIFEAWKDSIGLSTTVVKKSVAGSTSTAIKAYIQNYYDQNNLAFVLLVGDSGQVPTPSGGLDPTYSLVAGSDHYPDIFIGRFSAETAAQVDTQVERTLEFEQGIFAGDWQWKGTGIASNQGPGHYNEYDNVHMGYIRDDLLLFGYTEVDELYDPYATSTQVKNAVNEGRGIINYCGHGSTNSWGTTGFSSTDVNNLVNDNMLPFITSVACVNGYFVSGTCFAEAWLRATNGGEPTGAVGAYMSTQNQSWDPPMEAQDEFVDRYCDFTYQTYGCLCFAGSCLMMDKYSATGQSEFDHWHVFGDPSLLVHGGSGGPSFPQVDIKVNGVGGSIQVNSTDFSDITISLDPNDQLGTPHDWWVWAELNAWNKWWYQYPGWWKKSVWSKRAYSGPLVELNDYLLSQIRIPAGSYTITFCVDELNEILENTYKDTITVTSY